MDLAQSDNLKAYGVAYWTLANGENIDCTNSNWYSVGVDEYDPTSGLSEAELLDSWNRGSSAPVKGIVWAPQQLVLSPVNYGSGSNKIMMRGIDFDITYLLPEYKSIHHDDHYDNDNP